MDRFGRFGWSRFSVDIGSPALVADAPNQNPNTLGTATAPTNSSAVQRTQQAHCFLRPLRHGDRKPRSDRPRWPPPEPPITSPVFGSIAAAAPSGRRCSRWPPLPLPAPVSAATAASATPTRRGGFWPLTTVQFSGRGSRSRTGSACGASTIRWFHAVAVGGVVAVVQLGEVRGRHRAPEGARPVRTRRPPGSSATANSPDWPAVFCAPHNT